MSNTKSKKQATPAPKTRLTLLDLQPVSHRVTIQHPTIEELVFWVDLNSREHSIEYALKAYEYATKTQAETEQLQKDGAEMTPEMFQTIQERAAELVAICIKDWDSDAIGAPYSRDLAVSLLSSTGNLWMRTALENAIADNSNFFKKA